MPVVDRFDTHIRGPMTWGGGECCCKPAARPACGACSSPRVRSRTFSQLDKRRNRQTGAAFGVRANAATIVRDRYGANWRAEMEATTAKVAAHCLAAHGPGWCGRFAAIGRAEAEG